MKSAKELQVCCPKQKFKAQANKRKQGNWRKALKYEEEEKIKFIKSLFPKNDNTVGQILPPLANEYCINI